MAKIKSTRKFEVVATYAEYVDMGAKYFTLDRRRKHVKAIPAVTIQDALRKAARAINPGGPPWAIIGLQIREVFNGGVYELFMDIGTDKKDRPVTLLVPKEEGA